MIVGWFKLATQNDYYARNDIFEEIFGETMKYILILFLFSVNIFAQEAEILKKYQIDEQLNSEIEKIVHSLELDKDFEVGEDGIEQISLAVVDLKYDKPRLGGYNYSNFIYPASVYKIYVAAEILNQISSGKYSLYKEYVVSPPNDVDKTKEILYDPRPLLETGDTVTIGYLTDLMLTRSDNTAANCLIDIAKRENINEFIKQNMWAGSEVTRKFLSRKFEDPAYKDIRGTETSALHAADFLRKMEVGNLVNPWVSMQMKSFLGQQLDTTKLSLGLPPGVMFYHKTGWWSFWTHDVGLVDDGETKYIIACFLPIKEENSKNVFAKLSSEIYSLMKKRDVQIER